MNTKTNNIKRHYVKPTSRTIELQQRTTLLQASGKVGSKNSINNWGDGGTDNEYIYM